MQFSTTLVALVTVVSATLTAASPVVEARQQIYWCGKQPYKKTDYTCFPNNGNALCPITNGVKLLPCGSGVSAACYDPGNYGCNNGQLYLIQKCAGIPFDTNTYVCVDGFLCPKTNPLKCGGACYNISQYWCDNGVLKQQGQK